MTDLPDVKPVDLLTDADFREVFKGMADGWYRSADLAPRINAWLAAEGRRPVTSKEVGEALAREFKAARKRKVRGGVSMWYLNEATLNHRDWYTES